jgi:hypothetical protein
VFLGLCGLVLSGLGCMRSKAAPTELELAVASIRQEAGAYSLEGERDSFEVQALQALLLEHPQSANLYFLHLMALEGLSYAAPDEQRLGLYGQGKGSGRQCLRLNGAWAVMEDLSGGRLTVQALRRLDAVDLPCVRGLLFHWIRWVEHRGAPARIDLRGIGLLAERAVELSGETQSWRDHWALAMVAALDVPDEETRNRAEFHFQKAISMVPSLATPAIDRLSTQVRQEVYSGITYEALRQMGSGRYPVHPNAEWATQNQDALKRAIKLLAQLRDLKDE